VQHATPIYDESGNMIAGFSAFADITERKRAEEATRESEARYRSLIQHSGEAIYLLYNRKFEIVNNKFERMFGVTLRDVNAPTFDFINMVAPKSRPVVEERAKRLGAGEQLEPTYEFTAITSDGKEVDLEATVSYIKYKDGIATQGILRDITERNRLEEQLRQSQKMEAIGRLAGGVAHDFNNLLTVIIGYSELLLGHDLPRDAQDQINEIMRAGESAKRLTSQLLAFSRKQIAQPKLVGVNALLNEHNKMLRRLLGENIEIVTELEAATDTVLIDPGQIEQVVMNIAVNARDAMPFGGTLRIRTTNAELREGTGLRLPYVTPGSYLALLISDTGVGMNETVRSRVFEPFFTTKGRDKGTGLGLSTVYGIVKQNNGFIDVSSQPNEGTTFNILLPIADPTSARDGIARLESSDVRGTETVLLVEDDEGVRSYMMSILERQGYTVLPAAHGEEALRIHREHPRTIDLVVTDVVMPIMSGRELVDHLHATQPDLKCIFVSGYTDDAIVHHGVLDEGVVLIQKPFSRQALLAKIRDVLDKQAG
jgi:PAS domain S-box-containing protein